MTDKKASIVIIDSRSDLHPDWVQVAVQSAQNQTMPCEVIIIPNIGREHTIGECWNRAVEIAETEWVMFLGDDDYISRDYVQTLYNFAAERMDYQMVTSYMTAFQDATENNVLMTRIPTGMWRREYLAANPFNEALTKGVDREYIEKYVQSGNKYLVVPYHFGYFYRKHQDYSCAGRIQFVDRPSDYYFMSSNLNFLNPITERLEAEGKSVFVSTQGFNADLAEKAKYIWCDWAGPYAAELSRFKCDARKILRVHAFEVFQENSLHIDYMAFDKVVFVGAHIRDYLERQLGYKLTNSVVIPNGIDTNLMQIAPGKKRNNNIAWAGYITNKKGAQLLMFLANNLPDYQFHVAGKFQENDIAELFNTKLPDNMKLYTWQYDLNSFFVDKTFILNTSPRESHGVVIMEGMAAGLKPLVYDWIGAGDIYPGRTFGDMKMLQAILDEPYAPEVYRKIVVDGYSWDVIYPQIDKVIHG